MTHASGGDQTERPISRRTVMRGGVIGGAALVAWTTPVVSSWRPDPAHAVSPLPPEPDQPPRPDRQAPSVREQGVDGAQPGAPPQVAAAPGEGVAQPRQELARTGSSLVPLAAAGAVGIAAGAPLVARARARAANADAATGDD